MKTMMLMLSVACTLALSAPIAVAGPGKGNMTKHNVQLADCVADSVTVTWLLDNFGGARVSGTYRYESTDAECKPHYTTVVWLKVEGLGTHGYVLVDPVVPKVPGEWGYNVSGIPNWDEVLCGHRGAEKLECYTEEDARKLWDAGRVTDFEVAWDRDVAARDSAQAQAEAGRAEADAARAEAAAAEDALGLTRLKRRQMQKGLAAEGFNPGGADGVFGPQTRKAIRGWQAAQGAAATGYLTAEDVNKLAGSGGFVMEFSASREESTDEPQAMAESADSEASAATETADGGSVAVPGPGGTFRDCPECPELVVVPSGSFMMGTSPEADPVYYDDETPKHRVTIARPFAVGVYEVTFSEWDACVSGGGCGGYRPGDEGWGRGRHPVINVSREDAKAYARWLSERTGEAYRLLSESEWEYMARGGVEARFWWGHDLGRNRANCDGCGSRWDDKQSAPVGSFSANPFGVHDVHGNVFEWVSDCPNDSYAGAPSDGSAWRSGNCNLGVARGGSWYNGARAIRSAYRTSDSPTLRDYRVGFRIARRISR